MIPIHLLMCLFVWVREVEEESRGSDVSIVGFQDTYPWLMGVVWFYLFDILQGTFF